jgi:DNA invertase Pin-like site-specific DNA recombinase
VAKVGYGRISSVDQSLDAQESKLEENGCEKVFLDKQAGRNVDGPRLTEVLNYVRHGDSLVITRLDRLARSTYHLTRIAQELRDKGIDLVVLDQDIDTSTPTGKLFFDILASIAEFEADIRKDREKWT